MGIDQLTFVCHAGSWVGGSLSLYLKTTVFMFAPPAPEATVYWIELPLVALAHPGLILASDIQMFVPSLRYKMVGEKWSQL